MKKAAAVEKVWRQRVIFLREMKSFSIKIRPREGKRMRQWNRKIKLLDQRSARHTQRILITWLSLWEGPHLLLIWFKATCKSKAAAHQKPHQIIARRRYLNSTTHLSQIILMFTRLHKIHSLWLWMMKILRGSMKGYTPYIEQINS